MLTLINLKSIFFLMFCFFLSLVNSQEVLNIQAKQEGKQVIINYDLVGGNGQGKMEIRLYYGQRAGEWLEIISGVNGDIGKEVSGGNGKSIRWRPLQENNKLTGEGYQFKVSVKVVANDAYSIGKNMIWVEGGSFEIGCTQEQGTDCYDDEKPSQKVEVSGFYIGKYEVTQLQWKGIMMNNPSYFKECDECPVENVSWDDVQEFLKKINELTGEKYRMLTEVEWEYAARGGKQSIGFKYSGSDDINKVTWYNDNSNSKTSQVGLKVGNELGLYDISGNVQEWCEDWYGQKYFGWRKKYYKKINTKNAGEDDTKVVRGGSWSSNFGLCRVSFRGRFSPDFYYNNIGFRLAKD